MCKHVAGSWQALDDAIGPFRQALAHKLGISPDSLDRMCSPPPGFTRETATARGIPNWLDRLIEMVRCCPDGMLAIHWLAEQLGYCVVPLASTPHKDRLLISPADFVATAEALAREMNRRQPQMRPEQLDELCSDLVSQIHSLRETHRRRKAKEPKS